MKIQSFWLALPAILLLIIGFAWQNRDRYEELARLRLEHGVIGSWKSIQKDGYTSVIQFNDNGSANIYRRYKKLHRNYFTTYKVKDSRHVYFQDKGSPDNFTWAVEFNGDEIAITTQGQPAAIFKRTASTGSATR